MNQKENNANTASESHIENLFENALHNSKTAESSAEKEMEELVCILCASKILEKLNAVKSKPETASKRWVWELIQNAKDVPNNFGSVSIKIVSSKNKIKFSHNGKPCRDILDSSKFKEFTKF